MIFDSDVLIWALRNHPRALKVIDQADDLAMSVVSYMELIRGAKDKREFHLTKAYLTHLQFEIIPLSENIGHRAMLYMEEHGLKSNLGVPDALIAATAAERDESLCTGNAKDYRNLEAIELVVFRP